MRVPTSEKAMEELPKRKRKRSLSAIGTTSDDSGSEDGQVTSYASSVTLCAQSSATETSASNDKRLADVEKKLASVEEIIQRLLSAQEPVSPPASTPEDIYEPPRADTPEINNETPTSCTLDGYHETPTYRATGDIYEFARIESGLLNFHEWNAGYIHGMIRIDGKQSKSATKNLPCGPCAEAHKYAICVGLMDEDPFKEFLVGEKKVCCGWCEYEKGQSGDGQRSKERSPTIILSSSSEEKESIQQGNPKFTDIDGPESRRQPAKLPQFFISGEGIDREVITIDIPLYLGVDSTVRPGTHRDPETHKITEGYYITAHRPPTSAMLTDLRADSAEWRIDREKQMQKRKSDDATSGLEVYLGKQPPRYQTYHFDFDCR